MTYAFLYMGRYNINVAKNNDVMTKEQLGIITFYGMLTYGVSFVINGPLTDKIGGRKTIMMAAAGSALANVAMGILIFTGVGDAGNGSLTSTGVTLFSLAYVANMYFQSFGAVSIVKVNAHWFHVLERGILGGVFGILISLGVYFAYDWTRIIGEVLPNNTEWIFFMPAAILTAFLVIDYFLVFDKPSDAGYPDIDVADASSDDDGTKVSVWQVAKKMATNPIIVTIALIELCSGFIRNGIMKWGYIFLKEAGGGEAFAFKHWGMMLCIAGILGGVFAGTISDRVFQSRRGPSAVILYAMLVLAVGLGAVFIASPAMAYMLGFASLCIIGVHGMLSGTASADFGGKKNAGIAVGLIDGMVYLGSAAQAITFGSILPKGEDATDPKNWLVWLIVVLPVAIIGFLLAIRIWNAKPKAAQAASDKLNNKGGELPEAKAEG
jgi:OPA family glycerol-3-phosphate transporter-like MFS transporter